MPAISEEGSTAGTRARPTAVKRVGGDVDFVNNPPPTPKSLEEALTMLANERRTIIRLTNEVEEEKRKALLKHSDDAKAIDVLEKEIWTIRIDKLRMAVNSRRGMDLIKIITAQQFVKQFKVRKKLLMAVSTVDRMIFDLPRDSAYKFSHANEFMNDKSHIEQRDANFNVNMDVAFERFDTMLDVVGLVMKDLVKQRPLLEGELRQLFSPNIRVNCQ